MIASPGSPNRRRRLQLNEEAAAYIRDLILSGRLNAGDQVPVDQVADELQISATPVREALVTLRAEGFLSLEPRRGFIVVPLRPDDVHDMWRVQALIAGDLAARAAERISDTALQEAFDIQGRMKDAYRHRADATVEELNFAFHRLINRSADSPKLSWMLRLTMRYVPERFFAEIEGWTDASLGDHTEILQALKAHDPERARTAMREHLEHAERLLLEHYERLGSAATSTTVQR